MTLPDLTDTQRSVLRAAAEHPHGRLESFPRNMQGSVRIKVLQALHNAGLTIADGTDHYLTEAGYAAIGATLSAESAPIHAAKSAAAAPPISPAAAPFATEALPAPPPGTRAHSKQAQILALLRRSEGATITQICEATGWQKHTVRGTFAGVFKKRLGLTLTSEKVGGERIYRITATPAS